MVNDHGMIAGHHYDNRNVPAALEEISKAEVASQQVLEMLRQLENS